MKLSTAILLALGLGLLMAVNSADFFFRQPYYEYWDTGSNALAVENARHFSEMYGHYSRWMFRHPGPAFFYVDAFGEWLFHDTLGLTPAAYNGVALINLCLMVGFLVTAWRLFTVWLPPGQRGGFLFLALAAGIVHFGSITEKLRGYDVLRGSSPFLSSWPVDVLVLPFLCLLTASASVAAGRGRDLPLLALVDGFLIHGYVAQPLFVVPLSLLAYTGLLVHCARHGGGAAPGGAALPRWRRAARWPGAAWRAHRGAHLGALALALFFALPLILDVFRGSASNLKAILKHVHEHHDEHKRLLRSLLFFLQFGAYTPYRPEHLEFGRYDASGVWAYLRAHALVYAAWLAATLLAGWALIAPAWSWQRRAPVEDAPAGTAPTDADRHRFLAWAAVFLAAAVVLTLRWGVIMDGGMYYYNAWFNFAIYYFLALLAAAVLAGWPWLRWVTGGGGWQGRPRLRAALAVALSLLLAVGWADRFRLADASPDTTRLMHQAVASVLAATAPAPGKPPSLAVFDLPPDGWPGVIALAVEMKRAGRPFAVKDYWWVIFNETNGVHAVSKELLGNARTWRFGWLPGHTPWICTAGPAFDAQRAAWSRDLENALAHSVPGTFPLLGGAVLTMAVPSLDPADTREGAAEIRFATGGNSADFVVAGWSEPEGFGAWNNDPVAVVRFQPVAVSGATVELTLVAMPFLQSQRGLKTQRVQAVFAGEPLGPEQPLKQEGMSPLTFSIPAERWNRAVAPDGAGTTLVFHFPDATSPDALTHGVAGDNRPLALAFQTLRFRVVPAPTVPVAGSQP